MVLSKNKKKIMYTPANPSFTIKKWGLRGSKLYRHVFVMSTVLSTYFRKYAGFFFFFFFFCLALFSE